MTKTILNDQAGQATLADDLIADPNATVALKAEQACEAACPSNPQPTNGCEAAIRAHAHSKWEAAGCPAGDGFDFWLEAEREVSAEKSGSNCAQD